MSCRAFGGTLVGVGVRSQEGLLWTRVVSYSLGEATAANPSQRELLAAFTSAAAGSSDELYVAAAANSCDELHALVGAIAEFSHNLLHLALSCLCSLVLLSAVRAVVVAASVVYAAVAAVCVDSTPGTVARESAKMYWRPRSVKTLRGKLASISPA